MKIKEEYENKYTIARDTIMSLTTSNTKYDPSRVTLPIILGDAKFSQSLVCRSGVDCKCFLSWVSIKKNTLSPDERRRLC